MFYRIFRRNEAIDSVYIYIESLIGENKKNGGWCDGMDDLSDDILVWLFGRRGCRTVKCVAYDGEGLE